MAKLGKQLPSIGIHNYVNNFNYLEVIIMNIDKAELIKSVRRAIRTHKDDGSVSVEVLADIIISRAKYYVSKDEEFRAKLIS